MKVPLLPVGTDDFAEMRQQRVTIEMLPFTIADKTGFLPDLLMADDKVMVFTRPVRFMKSTTLSMLENFLSIKDASTNIELFDGMTISRQEHAKFREEYQGQFPVIHLSFARTRSNIDLKEYLSCVMGDLYRKNKSIISSLDESMAKKFTRVINREISREELVHSLADLARYLKIHYKKKVILLIDEYDTPFNNKNESCDFLEIFVNNALEADEFIEKSFLVGVLPIVFLSLNNAAIYSVINPGFADLFGCTESDIQNFLSKIEGLDKKEISSTLKHWYDGYQIAGSPSRVYNPWSVAKFFNALSKRSDSAAESYWLQVTDSVDIYKYLKPRFKRLQSKLVDLILGRDILVTINEYAGISDLDSDASFWALLLHCGFLKSHTPNRECRVSIPNYEVRGAYLYILYRYQQELLFRDNDVMSKALIDGDIAKFVLYLQKYIDKILNLNNDKHVEKRQKSDVKIAEQAYYAVILWLFPILDMEESFEISSSHEKGYDIVLSPKKTCMNEIVFKFKATDASVTSGSYTEIQFCDKNFSVAYKSSDAVALNTQVGFFANNQAPDGAAEDRSGATLSLTVLF